MLDPFEQKKQAIITEISATLSDLPDASPKGTIDEFCWPVINIINRHSDMVTTSLCLGRVSVFLEGHKGDLKEGEMKIGAKGNEGRWLFVTHDPKDLPGWHKQISFKYTTEYPLDPTTRYILFKFEPLILHVKCRDVATATQLYNTAMGCGFRESGIGSHNNVAIRTSIKLDVPIGYLGENDELVCFVTPEYLDLITTLSDNRFQENFKKMRAIERAIEGMEVKEQVKVETKEERRERKRLEGLARQQQLREGRTAQDST